MAHLIQEDLQSSGTYKVVIKFTSYQEKSNKKTQLSNILYSLEQLTLKI